MYNKKSIYSINKNDPDAIVYSYVNKKQVRLTREDFDSEDDFLKWKAWSDENYHDEEKRDHVEDNHTVPFSELYGKTGITDGPEVIIEQRLEKLSREQYTAETLICVKGQLTEKQFRRLWMYHVQGLTQHQIADAEDVGQQRISASIASAVKKIRKVFAAGGKK